MVMKERDEELTLFLEMRRREKENEKNSLLLLQNTDALDESNLDSNRGSSVSKTVSSAMPRKTGADEFLNSENEKSDYDWLLSPPGTPLFLTIEKESQISVKSEMEIPNARSTALKPRLANVQSEPVSRSNIASKNDAAAKPGLGSSTTANNRRPSSSGGPTSAALRSVTPSGRSTLPSTTKSSRPSTPTSRATLTSAKPAAAPARSSTPTSRATLTSTKPAAAPARSSTPTSRATLTSAKPAAAPVRSSTPTSRATLTSAKPAAPPVRSSTPTSTRSTARASTPTTRPSLAAPKTTRRSSTPTLRSSTPSSANGVSAPPSRSSSALKACPTEVKNPVQSRGSSPSVKSRPWEPSQMPGFTLEAPPNLKTSLSERPASASRIRPGAPSSRSSSLEAASSDGKSKRQSGTPSRGRASTGIAHSKQSSIQALSRSCFNDGDNDSPVVVGTKMVERVVNMRKLAPPRHDDHVHSSSGKSSLSESTGFGRTLSKKSLDMAMRHMDIRRSIKGNLRPLVTSLPASSVYSVRSTGSSNSRTANVSDSPLATSSTASSEPSVNFNSISYDGIEIEENDLGSDRGNSSPTSHHIHSR